MADKALMADQALVADAGLVAVVADEDPMTISLDLDPGLWPEVA
jgi:hypothetical protein